MLTWSIPQSKELYNIQNWGGGFVNINKQGELTISPNSEHSGLSLYQIAKNLESQDLSFPILVRFPNILCQRIKRLYKAFAKAMEREQY
ncbi:MAG: arginine decarboxylase, partial [Spirochaetota bacterium]